MDCFFSSRSTVGSHREGLGLQSHSLIPQRKLPCAPSCPNQAHHCCQAAKSRTTPSPSTHTPTYTHRTSQSFPPFSFHPGLDPACGLPFHPQLFHTISVAPLMAFPHLQSGVPWLPTSPTPALQRHGQTSCVLPPRAAPDLWWSGHRTPHQSYILSYSFLTQKHL